MAEFLIKAKDHPLDWLSFEDYSKLPEHRKDGFHARSQKGDIVVVRRNGWRWGRCEGLPWYVVVKVPEIKLEDVLDFDDPLVEGVVIAGFPVGAGIGTKVLRAKRWCVSKVVVDEWVSSGSGVVVLREGLFRGLVVDKGV